MPKIPLDALLVATGFTGALTLVWLIRLCWWRGRRPATVAPHFSPEGGCAGVIVREIASARRLVQVAAYVFTSRLVAQALVDARARGVAVEVILDPSNESDEQSQFRFLVEQGLGPSISADHEINHKQVVLIDGRTVLTGSFSFAPPEEASAAENLLVLRDHPVLARAFAERFEAHKPTAPAQLEPTPPPEVMTPAPQSAEDVLTAVAEQLTAAATPQEETPQEESPAVVTPAAADLFARLRKELAASGEAPEKKAG